MLLKLTEAKIGNHPLGLGPLYVSFAPGVVAYMQRRSTTYRVSAKVPESPLRTEEVKVEYTMIVFNSATHDDMNTVAVTETPKEIMEMIPRAAVGFTKKMQQIAESMLD